MANELLYPSGYINTINNFQLMSDTFAFISVTYPAGSTCTAVCGNTTLTAGDTSGEWVFNIPTPSGGSANWTISCSSGGNSASKVVSIGAKGHKEEVILKYLPAAGKALNTYSWSDISQVAQAGVGDDYWDIGDCKAITLNGQIGDYLNFDSLEQNCIFCVFILDFNHPINKTIADNNIIFGGFKPSLDSDTDVCLIDSGYGNGYTTNEKYFNMNHAGHKNYGGWKGCDFRYDILGATSQPPSVYGETKTTSNVGYDATQAAIINPVSNTLMAALPNDFRNVLRLWTRWTDNVGNQSNTDNAISACVDAGISLLSGYEVLGSADDETNIYEQNHQKQMTYYANGNNRFRFHHATNDKAQWWLCSSASEYTTSFCRITTAGNVAYAVARYSLGLAPAFKV